MDVKISGPKSGSTSQRTIDKALKSQLKAKQEGLKTTVEKYTEVVTMNGGEWKLAAVVEIGKAYDNYAETIINSYIPVYLSEDQAEMYKMNLEDRSYQYQQQALQKRRLFDN